MQLIKIGEYNCKYCKKDVLVRVHTDNPDLLQDFKEEAIGMSKNFHWYDNHYNCAICGNWIPSGERELVIEKDFKNIINANYNLAYGNGLLRVHKKCINKINK